MGVRAVAGGLMRHCAPNGTASHPNLLFFL
jgi:hypothetical protein